jgi:hypothetical protein
MTRSGRRPVWSILAILVIVGLAISLVGCANVGPVTPIAVSDVKSVSGMWGGVMYLPGPERDDVTLTIRDDGTYEVVWKKALGTSRGKGYVAVRDGRLVLEGARGLHGVGTVLRNPAGDMRMKIEATLSDNSYLSADLWPTR